MWKLTGPVTLSVRMPDWTGFEGIHSRGKKCNNEGLYCSPSFLAIGRFPFFEDGAWSVMNWELWGRQVQSPLEMVCPVGQTPVTEGGSAQGEALFSPVSVPPLPAPSLSL